MSAAPETKVFTTDAVMSVLTGMMMTQTFGDIHECIEWVVGHPVWTHELGRPELWTVARDAVLSAAPALQDAPVFLNPADDLRGAEWLEAIQPWMSEVKALVGETVELPKGVQDRTASPVETLLEMRPDAQVVVVTVEEGGAE